MVGFLLEEVEVGLLVEGLLREEELQVVEEVMEEVWEEEVEEETL